MVARSLIVRWNDLSHTDESDNEACSEFEDAPSKSKNRRRRGPIRFPQLTQAAQEQVNRQVAAQTRQLLAGQDPTLLDSSSNATYASLSTAGNERGALLSSPTLRALNEICGVNQMTVVQSSTFALARMGWSLNVRSKTGTGKTLAALVPLVERLLEEPLLRGVSPVAGHLSLLVVAPTRELVQQIGTTASDLLTFHSHRNSNSPYGRANVGVASSSSLVQVVFGGTNIMGNVRNMERQMPRILVATPGRLVELLEFKIRGRPLKNVLSCSRGRVAAAASPNPMMVWLDEADLLLDSFGPELRRIMQVLPRKRQTLLFSATWPTHRSEPLQLTVTNNNEGRRRPGLSLSQVLGEPGVGFQEVDCVTVTNMNMTASAETLPNMSSSTKPSRPSSSPVNVNVEEYYMSLPCMTGYVSSLVTLLKHEILSHCNTSCGPDHSPARIVVFLPAAKMVQFLADRVGPELQKQDLEEEDCRRQRRTTTKVTVHAIHSRMSQARRQRVSQAFRACASIATIGNRGSGRGDGQQQEHQVLFTSDVSARGMDYPNVTLVLQYGVPNTRELYLHRLGRTARAGQFGWGLLVALPFEAAVITADDESRQQPRKDGALSQSLGGGPSRRRHRQWKWIRRMQEWEPDHVVEGTEPRSPSRNVEGYYGGRGLSYEEQESAQAAYKAFVAYYVGQGHDVVTIVGAANAWWQGTIGCPTDGVGNGPPVDLLPESLLALLPKQEQ